MLITAQEPSSRYKYLHTRSLASKPRYISAQALLSLPDDDDTGLSILQYYSQLRTGVPYFHTAAARITMPLYY